MNAMADSDNKIRHKKKKRKAKQFPKSQELQTENSHPEGHENDQINKRLHSGDETDNEVSQKPKKKKKRQQIPTEGEASGKKGTKSIRQMKKEKHAQRQAAAEAEAREGLKSQCLTYLSQWKHDKQNWKFMKAKQVWVYKNKFNTKMIPKDSWPLLLEYFISSQGNIRKMLLDDANKVIKQMDEWTESQNKNSTNNEEETEDIEETDIKKPDDDVYKRARDVIQCLQE